MIFGRPSYKWEGAPTPEEFYKGFGFDEVHTLDVSSRDGASHIHDLNKPLPAELLGQYDVVLSGGTLEHVFDIANALRCLAGLVKVGGTVICSAPVNNWIDHGFWQVSPTLKFDFFSANGFEFGRSRGVLSKPKVATRLFVPFYPGEVHRWNGGGYRISHALTAQRLPDSTVDKIPIQGRYLENGHTRRFRFETFAPEIADGSILSSPPLERFTLSDFRPLDGRWAAPFHSPEHHASIERLPFRSHGLIYEDGVLLQWIVSQPAMVKERPGSFFHAPRFVHFSTTDGSDPRSNGRHYEIAFPNLPNWLSHAPISRSA